MIKKANASKLKQSEYVYILQPKADHQGRKISSTGFRWIGPYIIEKVLPNNNYVVRKIGNNKTHILHRMRLRQFTPRQPIPDIPVTPREWQPDPEVIIKHDGLYEKHGTVSTTRQYLTVIAITWSYLIHPKSQYELKK